MRKQTLAATAVLLGAGTLSLTGPAAPSLADAWKPTTKVPFPAGTVTEVEVVSTGPGDAVAAAVIDGAVHAYTAINGKWTGHDLVRSDVDATGLVLASNGSGEAAVGWEENVSGDVRFRVSRQESPTSWTGLQLFTPAGTDLVGTADLDLAGNGRVIGVATVDGQNIDDRLLVTEWAPNSNSPAAPATLSTSDASNPSLDVNAKGEALVAYAFYGLIDPVVSIERRTAGGSWSLAGTTSNFGDPASQAAVALSDNGSGRVIYSTVANGFYVAETSRILPNGTVTDAEFVSPVDEFANEPDVAVNDSGSALFTWQYQKNGTTGIRFATAANNVDPASSFVLPDTAADAADPTAAIGDDGVRVIQHSGSGKVVTHHKTSQVQPFSSTSVTGYGADEDVDVDSEGNAISLGFKPGDGVYARFFDTAGPTVKLANPKPTTLGTSVPVSWTATDTLSTIKGTSDVFATEAAWNKGTHSDPAIVVNDASGTETSFAGTQGSSYCVQVVAGDTAGNSTSTPKRCTSVPLDDRKLAGKGWQRAKGTGHYRNTITSTTTKGRTLTVAGVKAKQLALVITRSGKGGKAVVKLGKQTLKTVSFKGKGRRIVVPLASFGSVRSGKVTIKVTSPTGRKVSVDGLVVTK